MRPCSRIHYSNVS